MFVKAANAIVAVSLLCLHAGMMGLLYMRLKTKFSPKKLFQTQASRFRNDDHFQSGLFIMIDRIYYHSASMLNAAYMALCSVRLKRISFRFSREGCTRLLSKIR